MPLSQLKFVAQIRDSVCDNAERYVEGKPPRQHKHIDFSFLCAGRE